MYEEIRVTTKKSKSGTQTSGLTWSKCPTSSQGQGWTAFGEHDWVMVGIV